MEDPLVQTLPCPVGLDNPGRTDQEADDQPKRRSVSFSLPEDHDVSREMARDARAVLTCQQTAKGECRTTYEEILITRRDGTKVLITDTEARYRPPEVTTGNLCFMRIFAVIAAILFPPIGLAAVILTFRAHKAYAKAQETGALTVDSAKAMKMAERLIITAVICGLLMWGVILIACESMYQSSGDDLKEHTLGVLKGDR